MAFLNPFSANCAVANAARQPARRHERHRSGDYSVSPMHKGLVHTDDLSPIWSTFTKATVDWTARRQLLGAQSDGTLKSCIRMRLAGLQIWLDSQADAIHSGLS